MLLTEQEALRKRCPFSQVAIDPASQDIYGNMPNPHARTCAASGCMAWRQKETPEFTAKAEAAFKRSGERLASDTGYCGLAGAP